MTFDDISFNYRFYLLHNGVVDIKTGGIITQIVKSVVAL